MFPHAQPGSSAGPLPLRVFVSSPGDVPDERAAAVRVIQRLGLIPVSWDQPGASVPMLAHQTPQHSVNQGLSPPSECEAVVVILAGRMGTPLPVQDYRKPDGRPYRSGTEWEFCDAVAAAQENCGVPHTLVYRRQPAPAVPSDDPDRAAKVAQQHALDAFFHEHFRYPDGSLRGGFTAYTDPAAFERQWELDLRATVGALVGNGPRRVVSVFELRNAIELILQRRAAEAMPILLAQSRIAPTHPTVLFAQALAQFGGKPVGTLGVSRQATQEAVRLLQQAQVGRPNDPRLDYALYLIRRLHDEYSPGVSLAAPPAHVSAENCRRKLPPVGVPSLAGVRRWFADLERLLTTNL